MTYSPEQLVSVSQNNGTLTIHLFFTTITYEQAITHPFSFETCKEGWLPAYDTPISLFQTQLLDSLDLLQTTVVEVLQAQPNSKLRLECGTQMAGVLLALNPAFRELVVYNIRQTMSEIIPDTISFTWEINTGAVINVVFKQKPWLNFFGFPRIWSRLIDEDTKQTYHQFSTLI